MASAAGLGGASRQGWAAGPSALHPWPSSPPVNTSFVSDFLEFWGFVWFFCSPFAGSDVALAPVVTCFITSSFNNVSTELKWSFTEHTLSSNRTSCTVSLLQR